MNKNLVHFRTLDTQVRTMHKTANELCGSFDDLQKFVTGAGDCSLELIQKFLSASFEYPQVESYERVEKSVQTESFDAPVEKDNAVVQFEFLNLITALQTLHKKRWSVPLAIGGIVFQIGVMKMTCKIEKVPKLQIAFRKLFAKEVKDEFSLMISVLNQQNGRSLFEKKISGINACNLEHVSWTAIEKCNSKWLDSEGSLTVVCAKVE